MAVMKMKLVNIVGPINEFDRVVQTYVMNMNIHLENTMTALINIKNLYPFVEANPYDDLLHRGEELIRLCGLELPVQAVKGEYKSIGDISRRMDSIYSEVSRICDEKFRLEQEMEEYTALLKQLKPMSDVDIPLGDLFLYEFIKFRFGRMPEESYKKLETYLNDIEAFFVPYYREKGYVWGIYFTPADYEEKTDGIFASLYFERIKISGKMLGKPADSVVIITKEMDRLREAIDEKQRNLKLFVQTYGNEVEDIYMSIKYTYESFGLRRYAAHTRESFYILGWVPEEELNALTVSIENEADIITVIEEAEIVKNADPPTKLKNWGFFKYFEQFVKMYGLPSYNEIDPTPIVAITYIIIFGMMFGDVGQGFVIVALGIFLSRFKKMDFGNILVCIGVSSVVFGFVYGSVFGIESENMPRLISPHENINTVLILSVVYGVVMLLLAMALNIINGIKQKNVTRFLFDQNGISGFVLYLTAIVAVGASMFFHLNGLAVGIIVIFIVIPILLIFIKEPVERRLEKHKDLFPEGKLMFFIQTFFEVFEILLSFVTNTVSFVRIGAFALIHAGMMSVVFIFSDMAGTWWLPVVIIGNIFVMGLEGLVVGIQTLRLEFYELFSRFYNGGGRAFASLNQKVEN